MKELSQKTLRLLAQFTSEGVLILDREGNICRTNDTLKQIFGIPGNELNALFVDALLGKGFFERISNELAYVNQSTISMERKILIRPGKFMHLRCTSLPLAAEEAYSFMVLVHDITELRECQEAIQQNRELHSKFYIEKELSSVLGISETKELMKEEIRISKEMKTPLSILFFDKKFFEYIHFAYSFFWKQKGMSIFRDEVQRMASSPIDIGRADAESFVILLPWIKQEAAEVIAEKIRKRVELLREAIEVEEMNLVQGFGVAELDIAGQECVDNLLIRASQYRIKEKNGAPLT